MTSAISHDRIAVIIPCFNVENHIEKVVAGIPSFVEKIITVDDASTDRTLDILKSLKGIAPEIKEIKYQVGYQPKPQPVVASQTTEPSTQTTTANQTPNSNPQHLPQQQISLGQQFSGLNPKYTFETFIIGKNNELAHAASLAVGKNPGSQYNPLFIYGGVGLGKTHLMHAVGNKILHENPKAKILYVTSEKFTNDYINAISQKRMEDFKRQYRTADMLMVDDIQFIAGKEGTQEEFFHTFNELRDKGKQIIMTADRLPKEIPAIEQRLVSRFEWGMVADIQAPDFETRLAILRTKTSKKGISIEESILFYIAENIITNIRELEGALNRLLVYQQMENTNLSLEQAKTILGNVVAAKKKVVTIKKIALSVADFYNITMEDLIKQSRRKEYVKPRQIAMFLVRKELNSSYPTIGDFFGGRDHTTVMHGVEKMEKLIVITEALKQEIDLILDKLYLS
jgi:chromosomal replication initiator protein